MIRIVVALFVVTGGIFLMRVQPAEAGCGCDHPPPVKGLVYPRFASIGSEVTLTSKKITSETKGCVNAGFFSYQSVEGSKERSIDFEIPWTAGIGPRSMNLWDNDCWSIRWWEESDYVVGGKHLTVLSHQLPVIEATGTFYYKDVVVAVDSKGAILLPFDLTDVRAPMQFFVTLHDLPLRFDVEGINYYNKDEFDLKLFGSHVESPEDYQWGAFFGASVEGSNDPGTHSDIVSYWRHEFVTYADAHEVGGSHEVDEDERHPDGTIHVDHYNLIAAMVPTNGAELIEPGQVKVTVEVYQVISEEPLTTADLTAEDRQALAENAFSITLDHSGAATITPIDELLAEDAPPGGEGLDAVVGAVPEASMMVLHDSFFSY